MTVEKVVRLIEKRGNDLKNGEFSYSLKFIQGYVTALENIMEDINSIQKREMDGEMTELGDRNYALISRGIKSCGSYDPSEILFMFEEQLYVHEADTIVDFLQWVHDGKQIKIHGMTTTERYFGSGNYEERFQEFLKSRVKTVG